MVVVGKVLIKFPRRVVCRPWFVMFKGGHLSAKWCISHLQQFPSKNEQYMLFLYHFLPTLSQHFRWVSQLVMAQLLVLSGTIVCTDCSDPYLVWKTKVWNTLNWRPLWRILTSWDWQKTGENAKNFSLQAASPVFQRAPRMGEWCQWCIPGWFLGVYSYEKKWYDLAFSMSPKEWHDCNGLGKWW